MSVTHIDELDPAQQEVVKAVLEHDGIIFVSGGAGSGKTSAALWATKTFLERSKSPHPRALFLTFSRAAVAQIVTRSPQVLAGAKDRGEIMTFHALAFRMLSDFGRYEGGGRGRPLMQSPARSKLLGSDPSRLSYDDLIPLATDLLLRSSLICQLWMARWSLIICDEAQDTSPDQWRFLQLLEPRKLLLLGDANQMIYTFVPGVSPSWFKEIQQAATCQVQLPDHSHRDPSGAIPTLAECIRARDFENEAVRDLLQSERLSILQSSQDSTVLDLLTTEIRTALDTGCRDIAILAQSNASVVEIADHLHQEGIDHVLIGIPEAHGEALNSMAVQCQYAVGGASPDDLRTSLAIFLTSVVRGKVPEMANALIGETLLPDPIKRAVRSLASDLRQANQASVSVVATLAMKSWPRLAIADGYRPWQRAARHFRRLVSSLRDEQVTKDNVERIASIVAATSTEALMDLNLSERGVVRLMNFHQTKGREADLVILCFRDDDYFGREDEPFRDLSRLLYVALSRARTRVIVLLPDQPHPLVRPFSSLMNLYKPSACSA